MPSYRCEGKYRSTTDLSFSHPKGIQERSLLDLQLCRPIAVKWNDVVYQIDMWVIQSGLYRVANQCLSENRSGGRQRV